MVRAVLLLNVNPAREKIIAERLLEIPQIVEVLVTFGDYDVFALVETNSPQELAHLVTSKIRKIPGVNRTVTLLEAYNPKEPKNKNY